MNSARMLRRAIVAETHGEIWDYSWTYSAGNPPAISSGSVTDQGDSYLLFDLTTIKDSGNIKSNFKVEAEIKLVTFVLNTPQLISQASISSGTIGVGCKIYFPSTTTIAVAGGTIIGTGDYTNNFVKIKLERNGTTFKAYVNDSLVYSGGCVSNSFLYCNGLIEDTTSGSAARSKLKSIRYRSW